MKRSSGAPRPESLIATKLCAAEFDSRLISRRALFDGLLGRGSRPSVMSIVAAAGSGKSTLMAELHRTLVEGGVKTVWLSLDANDNSPATFTMYFVSALRSINPELAERELALLRGNPVQDFDALFDRLLRAMCGISSEVAIFLDDFQHVTDGQVLTLINNLATHMPASMQMVIASRSRLPLEFGRLRVSGLLAEVEQDDLNFDSSQVAEFLQRLHKLELNQDDLEALLATTEGWPTGVQLAALALRRHSGPHRDLIDTFSGRDQNLTSFLVESVLRSQPETVRTFLLRTAALRRMCPDLCEAVSGHPNSAEMLAHIQRSNLFLISLDRDGHWYRYHHLFAEFLLSELRRAAPGKFESVCDKAAQWCERNGLTTEAIQYALDGHSFEKASDLIADNATAVSLRHGDHYTMLDWMSRLPEAYHGRRPEILLGHAWSLAFSRGIDRSMEITDRVLARLRDGWTLTDDERKRLRLVARVTQAIAEGAADRLESCVARSLELRAQLPESEPFLISSICNCLSYCHLAKREFESSAQVAADSYLYGHRAGSEYVTSWADFLHGLADVELGRLRTAQEHSRRMEENARTAGSVQSYQAGLAALLNAEIATQRCEFDKTRLYMDTGKSFIAVFGPLEPSLVAFRNLARQFAWVTDIANARQVLMQGQDIALTLGQPRLFLTLAIEEAVLRLNAGDVDGARETAQRTRLHDDKAINRGLSGSRGLRDALQLLQARLLIADDKAAAALRILVVLQHAMPADKCGNIGLTVKAVKAIALWRSGRPAEAVRELDRALSAAAAEFQAYPIVSAGADLLPVLRAIGERRAGSSAIGDLEAKQVLQHWLVSVLTGDKSDRALAHANAIDHDGSSESLTEREAELLRLVESGLANKQLADALLVSESTVKWHLHNIYSKIGVRNRTAATARARELGMI